MSTLSFTVFTPTYNRADILGGVYYSLLEQTFRGFEWLIVDDGSTDHTGDLVMGWQREALFPIRYIHQDNRGKHVATNVGVREAKGDFFLILDSDDTCVPDTLEQFKSLWESIPEHEKNRYSTVSVLCANSKGEVVGRQYPCDVVDAKNGWQQLALRSSGERFGVNRTDILRSFPFPQFDGEKFIPEGIVWNRMALQYRTIFANKVLRIYKQRSDSLSASSIRIRANSPIGTSVYYNELNHFSLPVWQKVKAAINYARFSFHGKIPVTMMIKRAESPLPVLFLAGLGYILYKVDNSKL